MTPPTPNSELPAILGGDAAFPDAEPAWPPVDEKIADVLRRMAIDGSWGRYFGPHGESLVDRLRSIHDCEHVLLCSSGRAAGELALIGLGIVAGDEVAMSAYDFHSNFAGIRQVGATPVLIDVREPDAQLDVAQLNAGLSAQTKAVIASHLHGGIVDIPALKQLADERNVAIIEDACQASGATVDGRPAGMWGDVGVLSFGGSKLLTAGRGGALLTNRADVIQRIRRHLRGDNHTCPLSEMQAAVLLPQLDQLADRHQRRMTAVAAIRNSMAAIDGFRLFEVNTTQSSPAYYKVGFVYDPAACGGLSRERFIAALRAEGLAFDVGLPPLHLIHSRRNFRTADELPVATRLSETVVGLHHPVLLNEDVDWSFLMTVIEGIRDNADEIGSPT